MGALTLALVDQFPEIKDAYVFVYQGDAQIQLIISDAMAMSDTISIPRIFVTQLIREMILSPTDTKLRLSQVVVEYITKNPQAQIVGTEIRLTIG